MGEATHCRDYGVAVSGRQSLIALCQRCEKKALNEGRICESCKRRLDAYPCDYCGLTAASSAHPLGIAILASLAVGVLALLYFVGSGIVGLMGLLSSDGGPQSPAHSDVAAFVMCRQFAEDCLRAPSTADWPSSLPPATRIEHAGEGRYLVQTYVDAQNAFGALIRSDISCQVQYRGGEREVSDAPRGQLHSWSLRRHRQDMGQQRPT